MQRQRGLHHSDGQGGGQAGGQAGQKRLEQLHQRHGLRHSRQCSGQAHRGEGGGDRGEGHVLATFFTGLKTSSTYVSSSISLQPWFLRIIWTFSSDLGLPSAPEASTTPQPATKSSYKNQLQVRSGKPSFVQTFANITFESRSGPLEDLRRLGKLFSEEYAADLDKVGCLDTFHWIALICCNRLP